MLAEELLRPLIHIFCPESLLNSTAERERPALPWQPATRLQAQATRQA
jgi:hypothetical protein